MKRTASAPAAWATLLLLAASQAALFVHAAHGSHGYCAEHEGAVHELDAEVAPAVDATVALVAPGAKKASEAAHDHCEALGTGLRPALKPSKSCTPRFEKQPVSKPPKVEARPIASEPVYANAPKTSPPLA